MLSEPGKHKCDLGFGAVPGVWWRYCRRRVSRRWGFRLGSRRKEIRPGGEDTGRKEGVKDEQERRRRKGRKERSRCWRNGRSRELRRRFGLGSMVGNPKFGAVGEVSKVELGCAAAAASRYFGRVT